MNARGRARVAGSCLLAILLTVAFGTAPEARGKTKAKGKKARAAGVDPGIADCQALALRGSLALVGCTSGLRLHDVTDPEQPVPLGELRLRGRVRDVVIRGDRAFVAADTRGVHEVDLSDPTSPALLRSFDTPGRIDGLVDLGTHLAAIDPRAGIEILDFEPDRPRSVRRISTRQELRGATARTGSMVTAEGQAGLRLFDVSDPTQPRELRRYSSASGARDVAIDEAGMVVAAGRNGLLVYDWTAPRPIGELATRDGARRVAIEGPLVALAGSGATLTLVDVSERARPVELSTVRLHRNAVAGEIVLRDGWAYVAVGRFGLTIVDLRNPSDPRLVFPKDRRMRILWDRGADPD